MAHKNHPPKQQRILDQIGNYYLIVEKNESTELYYWQTLS